MGTAIMKDDVMIDIETLGTTPDSVILSIAAVKFDRISGVIWEEFYMRVRPNQTDRKISEETVRWWLEQPPALISESFSGSHYLVDGLNELRRFVCDSPVWSQGTDFDFSILDNAFNSCGIPTPWKYNAKRDTRTAYDVCGFDPKSIEREGTYHNALDDCKHQIKCVVAAMSSRTVAS